MSLIVYQPHVVMLDQSIWKKMGGEVIIPVYIIDTMTYFFVPSGFQMYKLVLMVIAGLRRTGYPYEFLSVFTAQF